MQCVVNMEGRLLRAFQAVVREEGGQGYGELYRDVYAMANGGELEAERLAALLKATATATLRSCLMASSAGTTGALARRLAEEWRRVELLDRFVVKLVSGRRRLLSLHPHLPAVAALAYRDLLADHPAIAEWRSSSAVASSRSLESELMCEGMEQESSEDDASIQATLDTIHQGVEEAIRRAEQMSEIKLQLSRESQKPFPRTRFTRSKNLIHELDDFSFMPSRSYVPERTTYFDLGLDQIGFVLENVFTPEECQALIAASEKVGYGSLEGEFLPSMRDNKRALIMCPALADELWNRVRPFVENDERIRSLKPFGFNSQGTWHPFRLNPLFRFCHYVAPSVGFLPHRDASFIGGAEERSILTIMLYLSDDFEGGTTNFLRSHTGGRIDETIQEELSRGYDVVYRLRPKPGLCVIFQHTILHEGAPITAGNKYLLRTDVVFKRVEDPKAGDESYRAHPLYRRMVRYYKLAAEEECQGRVDKSSELYERALSIRQWYREEADETGSGDRPSSSVGYPN